MNFTNINAFYSVQGQKLHFGFTVTHLKKVWLTISRWRSLKFHISLATKRRKNPVVKSRTKFSPRHAIAEKKNKQKQYSIQNANVSSYPLNQSIRNRYCIKIFSSKYQRPLSDLWIFRQDYNPISFCYSARKD